VIELPTDDEPVKVIHGDCLDVLRQLPDGCVDAVITDPPYGVDFQGKGTKHTVRSGEGYISGDDRSIGPAVVTECLRVAKRMAVIAPAANLFDYPRPVEVGSFFCPSGAGLGRWGFIMTHPILYYGKCPYLATGQGHRPNSLMSYALSEKNGHPCPKPLEWMRWLIRKVSLPGELIIDPFGGSGTTAAAAMREGRKCLLIEKEAAYIDIIRNRLSEAGTLFAGVA